MLLCLSHTTRTWFFLRSKKRDDGLSGPTGICPWLSLPCQSNDSQVAFLVFTITGSHAGHLLSGSHWLINFHKVICHLIDHRVATTDGAFFTPLYLLPIWEIMCAFILPITRLYMLHAQLVKFFLEHRCALVCVRLNTNISWVLWGVK